MDKILEVTFLAIGCILLGLVVGLYLHNGHAAGMFSGGLFLIIRSVLNALERYGLERVDSLTNRRR